MPDLTLNQFNSHIDKGELNSLYLFWGPETYFHDISLTSLEKKVIPDSTAKSFNYHLFYANDSSINEIIATCISFPMMSDKKLVVVKHFDKMTIGDKDAFIKYIQNPQESTVLVLTAETWGKTKLHSEYKKNAISVKCKALYDKEVYQWVKFKFAEKNITADEEAMSFLIENVGFNILRLNVEIEKLSNLVAQDKVLSKDIVEEITGFSKDVNIFNLQHELGQRDLKNALQLGLKLLEQGETLASMLPMIYLFFKRMWIVKEMLNLGKAQKQILSELGGNAFYYRDIFKFHKNFSPSNFSTIFRNLEQSEILLKTSQKREDSILTMIIYNICKI